PLPEMNKSRAHGDGWKRTSGVCGPGASTTPTLATAPAPQLPPPHQAHPDGGWPPAGHQPQRPRASAGRPPRRAPGALAGGAASPSAAASTFPAVDVPPSSADCSRARLGVIVMVLTLPRVRFPRTSVWLSLWIAF